MNILKNFLISALCLVSIFSIADALAGRGHAGWGPGHGYGTGGRGGGIGFGVGLLYVGADVYDNDYNDDAEFSEDSAYNQSTTRSKEYNDDVIHDIEDFGIKDMPTTYEDNAFERSLSHQAPRRFIVRDGVDVTPARTIKE